MPNLEFIYVHHTLWRPLFLWVEWGWDWLKEACISPYLYTFSFNLVRWTQLWTLPSCLGTTTIPPNQSFGSFNFQYELSFTAVSWKVPMLPLCSLFLPLWQFEGMEIVDVSDLSLPCSDHCLLFLDGLTLASCCNSFLLGQVSVHPISVKTIGLTDLLYYICILYCVILCNLHQ